MAEPLLLDTSAVLTAVERDNEEILGILRRHGGPSIGSLFVLGELLHGVEAATVKRTRNDRQKTVEFYEKITEFPDRYPTDALAKVYARASARATELGLSLGMNDRWIVAEATLHKAQLVTCDAVQTDLARSLGCDTIFVTQPTSGG